ncbi:hypothetical protein [Fimbriiglobus ruber]|uniref:Uncharacterized protein n=1 Tax=Fimbriiglobus ruber TaxID=1908690 RepID=A0A225E4D4_9BACT|nr:hypothetical protein [Fimbriiglobus ruber]OWK46614.1 hypothetical protein FRUB_00313 [Fimbriiglobus ruber]
MTEVVVNGSVKVIEVSPEAVTVINGTAPVQVITLGIPGPPGEQGPIGPAGGGNSTTVEWQWNVSSPFFLMTIPEGTWVEEIQVYVNTAVNGVAPTMSVGDALDPARLVPAINIDPTNVGVYVTNPAYFYAVETNISLSIVPGTGATQGDGLVVILIS